MLAPNPSDLTVGVILVFCKPDFTFYANDLYNVSLLFHHCTNIRPALTSNISP